MFRFKNLPVLLINRSKIYNSIKLETAQQSGPYTLQKKPCDDKYKRQLEKFRQCYKQIYNILGSLWRVQLLELSDSIQLKLLGLPHFMLNQQIRQSNTSQQVYGFLCQKTNVFYAFQSYETYQQFLEWLQNQPSQEQMAEEKLGQMLIEQLPNEQEQMADCEMATREILKVFDDPVFELTANNIEMREIDF